jgi:sugar phosphate isomerase/epimerase
LKTNAQIVAGLSVAPLGGKKTFSPPDTPPFKISLAEWSLHRTLFEGKLNHLDFPKVAKQDYGVDAIELVNQFFMDKAKDQAYLADFKKRASDLGVSILLIMCDNEGVLGDPDKNKRTQAVENHYKWADAAKFFGCHSIRVNAFSTGTYQEQMERVVEGLRGIGEFCAKLGLNVLVENHGELSSNAEWLISVVKKVGLPNFGTLPDLGNFKIDDKTEYDRYKGVSEMMPYAKAVSAKSLNFDEQGNEIRVDYRRMMKIVLEAGYRGYVGIEYSGDKLSEPEGIRATKRLLEKVERELLLPRGRKRVMN